MWCTKNVIAHRKSFFLPLIVVELRAWALYLSTAPRETERGLIPLGTKIDSHVVSCYLLFSPSFVFVAGTFFEYCTREHRTQAIPPRQALVLLVQHTSCLRGLATTSLTPLIPTLLPTYFFFLSMPAKLQFKEARTILGSLSFPFQTTSERHGTG